ncbi:maltose O-acetyltransferase [Planomicrobium soli]|uniref:Maltose O-acetyltransferase n=1 Tax=Planomicrobium soli TaxID=1176648 RepID=A0A2P8H3C0_9BACL|nr:acyltransferase [Planomicrobium soli]PSL40703.1 maltose O-acetyltransferase [Planomicrobium soli]
MKNKKLERIKKLSKINLLKTFGMILKGYKIIVYPNTNVYIHKSAKIDINGSLELGKTWEKGANYKSSIILRENAKLIINGNFKVYCGTTITVNNNASLILNNGFINKGSSIHVFEQVKIGNNVIIAEEVMIRDSDNHKIGYKEVTLPIEIEEKVWIGTRATILKGVKIGKGSVIAACSLINKDVPSYSLVAGVPARVINDNIEWEQ